MIAARALPLSLLPASAWPLGQLFATDAPPWAPGLAQSFASTVFFCVASVALLASALFLLASLFGAQRSWNRAVAVSTFASVPVLVSGVLLVVPAMLAASLVACVHGFALCHLGAQRLLGCPAEQAPIFVACACILTLAESLLLGGLCSAAGLI